jgi:hypothetical protein
MLRLAGYKDTWTSTHRLCQTDLSLANLLELGLPLCSAFDWGMLEDLGMRDVELGEPGNDITVGHGHLWVVQLNCAGRLKFRAAATNGRC